MVIILLWKHVQIFLYYRTLTSQNWLNRSMWKYGTEKLIWQELHLQKFRFPVLQKRRWNTIRPSCFSTMKSSCDFFNTFWVHGNIILSRPFLKKISKTTLPYQRLTRNPQKCWMKMEEHIYPCWKLYLEYGKSRKKQVPGMW